MVRMLRGLLSAETLRAGLSVHQCLFCRCTFCFVPDFILIFYFTFYLIPNCFVVRPTVQLGYNNAFSSRACRTAQLRRR